MPKFTHCLTILVYQLFSLKDCFRRSERIARKEESQWKTQQPRYRTASVQWQRPSLGRRILSSLLCVVLLSNQLLATPYGFMALGSEMSASLAFHWRNSGWAAKLARWMPAKVAQQDTKGWDGKGAPPHTPPDPEPQEKHEDRLRKVSRVEISPRDVTIHTGEKIVFAVVAYDKDGSLVTGMSVKWEGSDDDKKRPQRVSPQGEFSSPVPGKYKITADIGGRKDSVKVIVIGDALNPSDKGVKGDPISTKDALKEKVSLAPQERIRGGSAPASSESTSLRRTASPLSQVSRNGLQAAAKPMAVATAAFQSGYDYYTWNGGNYPTADDPGKEVGQMPGHALDGGAGSGNFQFAAPIIGLDGRGINVNLTMTYNSRVWHKSGTDMYFDVDGDWQPGWTMGFGRIVTAGNGYMLIDGDGTRHSFSGNPWSYSAPNTSLQGFDGYTTDGTFINYYARGYRPQYGSYILNAWAKLPNGTTITYGASANLGAYPTQITDANGNYLTITYKSNQGPNIDTITDTLGRQVKFYYDANNLMTTITAPGFAGGGERVVARFLYDSAYLSDAGANYGFSGVNCRVKSNLINRIKAIYYPANNTGYWFGDSDSYSKYGMLRKISERRRMACSNCTNSLSDKTTQPNLTDTGIMSREMVYSSGGQPGYDSYGTTPPSGLLTDSPTYTQMTEDWYGRQTASAPVTTYSVQDLGSTRKTRITRPDGVTSEQITDNVTTSQTYGLMLEDKSYATASSTTPQQSSKVYWEVPNFNSYPTCDGAPRPNHTEVTDERGQMTSTYYTYVNLYNQVSDVSEYGYNGQLLRRTHKDYINTTPYVGYWSNNAYGSYFGRHIFNLVSAVEVYGPDNTTRVSRTEYQYDQQSGQSLISTPSVTQHQRASDPYDPGDTYCDWVWNEQTYTYDYVCNTYPVYDSGTDYRGNVTSVKRYADAVGLNTSTAVTETRSYDICGNVRITSTACCDQTSISYNINTQFAWPSSQTRGSASDPFHQNTTSVVYDFNTGLVNNSTDANGRTSTMQYHASSLRPEYENAPTGAYVYHSYYDNIAGSNDMAVIDFVYAASNLNGSSWANRVDKYLDGLGRVVSEIGFTVGFEMDMVNTKYDNIGRVWQQTRPYRLNSSWVPQETVQWTTYAYNPLDRVTSITAPDGSISYRFYNESTYPSAASSSTAKGSTVRIQDAWGRERWGRLDEQNRLVEVVEPNPSGDGTVANNGLLTQYSYNALGSLTDVTQGSQSRSFKYDDLGRMVAQRLAERDATLDESGQFVATWNSTTQQYSGGAWSDVFSYDTRSNLVWKKDARGVKTTFDYNNDPLNRLQSVSYSTSNVPTDYATRLGSLAGTIAAAPKVNYSYETTSGKDKTRLTNVYVDQGLNTPLTGMGNQTFGYDAEGRLSTVSQTFTGISGSYALNMSYGYDYLDRVTDVTYPAQYGLTTVGKVVHQNYDLASRLSSLTYDGTNFASNPVYNASSQTKSLTIGSQVTESYTFDPQTGLLTNQQVLKGSTALMNLDYNYTTNNATNNVGAKTGQLTFVKDNLNTDRNRSYSYDKLGRLNGATGGTTAPKTWTQAYSYDRYGNRLTVTKSGNDASNNAVALDGLASVSYNTANNRISSGGYQYDPAGNQVQSNENGVSKTFQYDAAGRLTKIFNSGGQVGCNIYGASNQRLQYIEGATTTYYAWAGSNVVAEYFPSGTNALQWNKSYVYLGGRLLATATNNAGTATTQFQHPDRLGTRLTTDTSGNLLSENVNLPFGASMPNATSLNGSGQPTLGEGYLPSGATQSTKKRFTSYERSDMTGLDYAVNRHYSATQGRFTQVDPIGMAAVSLSDPQSLNLYAYCGNDPINQIDPDGLFSWKKLFGFFSKALKIVLIVGLIVGAVLLGGAFIAIKLGIEAGGWFGSAFLGFMHGIGAAMGWASPSVVFSLAATGSAAAWAGAGIWAFGVMAGIGAVAAFTYNPQKAKQGKKAKTPVDNGGQFSPDKLAILNGVIDATREKLKDENCAAALGGKANAEKLLNRARPLSGNTINPEYKGTGGIATRGELPGETVAGTARRKALDPNSNNLAYSEVGGRHIYIQDRFFDITSQSGQITLYIHELNRLNGYSGGDKEDYARITKACGTEEPIRK